MTSTVKKMESGNNSGVDQKSSLQNPLNPSCMDFMRAVLSDRKAELRNSVKLKSEIHSQIKDLIETLKERERQLFLEIDEYDIDNFHLLTEKRFEELSLLETKSCSNEATKMHSPTFPQKKLEFIQNSEQLKTQLQEFGQIKEVEATDGRCGSSDESIPSSSSPQVKRTRYSFNELVRKLSKKNRSKQVRKESTDSAESFEIVDALGDEECQKYIESLKDEDDIEVVPNPVEFHPWQPSFPIRDVEYSHERKDSLVDEISEEISIQSKDQDPSPSRNVEEAADPVTQMNKQLMNFLQISSRDKKNQESERQTCQFNETFNNMLHLAGQREQMVQLPKTVPSQVIQNAFKKFLDVNQGDKWLASPSECCNRSCGLYYNDLNPRELHFK